VSCNVVVLYDMGVCGCEWSFKVSVSSDLYVCWVSLSVLCGVGVFADGMW